jgi:hypothetical protein
MKHGPDDEVVVLCPPTATMQGDPAPGATRDHCSICATEIWVAESSRQLAENPQLICMVCGPGVLDTQGSKLMNFVTPEQRAEMRAAGLSDAEIDRTVVRLLSELTDEG